jgi:hypothetical protein
MIRIFRNGSKNSLTHTYFYQIMIFRGIACRRCARGSHKDLAAGGLRLAESARKFGEAA